MAALADQYGYGGNQVTEHANGTRGRQMGEPKRNSRNNEQYNHPDINLIVLLCEIGEQKHAD
jgi:hypothetical protein